jgi:hypothetical protein
MDTITTTKKATTKKAKNSKNSKEVMDFMNMVDEVFADARAKMDKEAAAVVEAPIEAVVVEAPIEIAPIIEAPIDAVIEAPIEAVVESDGVVLTFVALVNDKINFNINKSKVVYSRKINPDGTFIKRGINYQYDAEKQQIFQIAAPVQTIKIKSAKVNSIKIDNKTEMPKLKPMVVIPAAIPAEPIQSEFSINQRFEFLEKFTNMVLDGVTASVIITGEGGLGKTHTVNECFKRA